MTEWRAVPGYEDRYEVSDSGLVRSRIGKTKPLAFYEGPYGHRFVALWRQYHCWRTQVGRLVLAAFVGPCPDGMECCHNDGDAGNNRLENLRWDTHSANVLDCVKHGTHGQAFKTHCVNGHPYDEANTAITRRGGRRCRQCERDRWPDKAKRRVSLIGRTPPRHGTAWIYSAYGCRCDECKAAKSAAMQRYNSFK
ncbi:NUMOD4 motif-containing HNH endonuclease [Mycolicibacterium conceptionense]|uniref:HNH endonuclease n=1 Tax=Mycolicibacterium conceptionense TaxID=451644 RepID=A0A1A1X5J8_9MYCO|nr:hypothetical protein A5726_25040 [Mycolicibacterium conceptionense]OBF31680.1 hypothetical protein A5720_28005 [Mycolicibacterium conceptionense]OBH97046.1 hypothetical protein A5716_16920 [Mycolicibacterium conceptionense]